MYYYDTRQRNTLRDVPVRSSTFLLPYLTKMAISNVISGLPVDDSLNINVGVYVS